MVIKAKAREGHNVLSQYRGRGVPGTDYKVAHGNLTGGDSRTEKEGGGGGAQGRTKKTHIWGSYAVCFQVSRLTSGGAYRLLEPLKKGGLGGRVREVTPPAFIIHFPI